MSQSINVEEIKQVSHNSFLITWSDGKEMTYPLRELQKLCPCAKCRSEKKNGADPIIRSEIVSAKRIYSVGRYAIRIEFTSGCSLGIYTYDILYNFASEENVN